MIDLDELERLCREATDAPWTYDGKEDGVSIASIGGCGCCGSPWIDAADGHLIVALRNAAPELIAMARRYQWLCEDHADAATRQRCREILERMDVRSESASSAAIDAAMQEQRP